MNKIFKPLAYLAVGYFAWRFLAKGFVATNVLNVKIRSLNLKPIKNASLVVELVNASNQVLRWDSMSFDLTIDGYSVGSLNYLKSGIIAANSSTTINLPIQINPVDSLSFIVHLTKQNFKVKNIGLKGRVNGEGISIPVDINQSINA